jgi:hypothetical protein
MKKFMEMEDDMMAKNEELLTIGLLELEETFKVKISISYILLIFFKKFTDYV